MPPSALPVTPAAAASWSASRKVSGRTLRVRGHPVHRRFAHTALRRVHHAPPAHFVVGVHERAEVREQVLDLAAVVELHAADDAVRNTGAHELLFDDAALRVGSVEHRDVVEAVPLGFDQTHRLAHHVGGLVVLVFRVVAGDELAADLLGPQLLRPPRRVVGDDGIGGVEDALRGPVVLLEHDHRRLGEHLLEPHDVPEVGPAELVDRVVRDEAFSHEVVRALDVEVVHLAIELDPLDPVTGSGSPSEPSITIPDRSDDAVIQLDASLKAERAVARRSARGRPSRRFVDPPSW